MKYFFVNTVLVFALSWASAQTLVVGQSGAPVGLDGELGVDMLMPISQILDTLSRVETVDCKRCETDPEYHPDCKKCSGVCGPSGACRVVIGLSPCLATSWESNEDATQWTFNLRDDVTFHDDMPFNAEAVKFNYDRWNFLDNWYNFVDEGKNFSSFTSIFGNYHGEEGYLIESVEVVDDYAVRFNLTRPVGYFPNLVASNYFGIHSPQAVMEGGIEYGGYRVVGTGPFTLTEFSPGVSVAVERYEGYWGEPANVEEIVFRGIESPATRLAELEAGSIDIALNLSPEDYASIVANLNLKAVIAQADLRIGYLGMHQDNEPFSDPRVRQVLAYAIDKQAIVDAFYGDLGAVANEFIPPTLTGRLENDPYPYDPERARELLAEAGYPDGFDTEILVPDSNSSYPDQWNIARMVATQLAEVGINATLQSKDFSTYLSDYLEGRFSIIVLRWTANLSDPSYISPFFNQVTAARLGYDSPELFDLTSEVQSAPSEEERAELYQQIEQILVYDLPAIPLVSPRTLNAVRADIEDFFPSDVAGPVELCTVRKGN